MQHNSDILMELSYNYNKKMNKVSNDLTHLSKYHITYEHESDVSCPLVYLQMLL